MTEADWRTLFLRDLPHWTMMASAAVAGLVTLRAAFSLWIPFYRLIALALLTTLLFVLAFGQPGSEQRSGQPLSASGPAHRPAYSH